MAAFGTSEFTITTSLSSILTTTRKRFIMSNRDLGAYQREVEAEMERVLEEQHYRSTRGGFV